CWWNVCRSAVASRYLLTQRVVSNRLRWQRVHTLAFVVSSNNQSVTWKALKSHWRVLAVMHTSWMRPAI
ncbi:acyl-CoA dehydrogenase, middle domain protein, partial [Vibrio parahaemolyticus V-223/04]